MQILQWTRYIAGHLAMPSLPPVVISTFNKTKQIKYWKENFLSRVVFHHKCQSQALTKRRLTLSKSGQTKTWPAGLLAPAVVAVSFQASSYGIHRFYGNRLHRYGYVDASYFSQSPVMVMVIWLLVGYSIFSQLSCRMKLNWLEEMKDGLWVSVKEIITTCTGPVEAITF